MTTPDTGGLADDWQLAAAPLATLLRMYETRDYRVGMRSGMMDAAALCDLIAEDIRTKGGKNKATREAMAVAKRCGDAIAAMRDEVAVPGNVDFGSPAEDRKQ